MPIIPFDAELDHLSEEVIRTDAPEYESEPQPEATARTATPPDGKDQDWRDLHPNGAKFLDNYETKEGTGE